MPVRESYVEREIRKYAVKHGFTFIKLMGMKGIPDRMVLGPGKVVAFLEVKRPGQKPTPIQQYRLKSLRDLGFTATWVDNIDDGKQFIKELKL